MTYTDLIKNIAKGTDTPAVVTKQIIEAFCAEIVNEVKAGNSVRIPALGTFSPLERAARVGRNPATGKTVQIPAKTTLKFKSSAAVAEAIDE